MKRWFILACASMTLLGALPGSWPRSQPDEAGMDASRLAAARDFALKGKGSGYVIRRGRLVYSWGDPKQRYDLKSSTKSIGATMLGVAVMDGKVKLEDQASKFHPQFGTPPDSNAATGWLSRITLLHLATHTAGFDKRGDYQPLLFEPGTKWSYSDGGPNWLAECLTLAYRRDLADVMFERVFTPLGITREDLVWRKNAYRPELIEGIPRREFGSGVHANVDAMARIGLLYLNEGKFQGKQILPESFVKMARSVTPAFEDLPVMRSEDYPNASRHYGLLWWNNNDGSLKGVPPDAFWSWGLHDSLIVVIPSLDLVVARAGEGWGEHAIFSRLEPFLQPIVESIKDSPTNPKAPYPSSTVIESVRWAPTSTIVRKAPGSDNWPTTWGEDDAIYTAYGDGNGFEPLVPEKLGLGFAKIVGTPDSFQGINIRSASGENKGSGPHGKKASGLLMVDGVLYMWARNAGNSQLAWSTDHAKTWTWSDWKFTTSFGHPTFLNFGRNYDGARDGYVYVYSTDVESAYLPSSRMILARVPKERIREQSTYEFFEKLDAAGKPSWTSDIAKRGAVFENAPDLCYRTQVSYNAGLKRYIMSQILPGEAPRFKGGFGVYDAPEPWGPWTTVFFVPLWDVGPGESSNFPTKWMSKDGRTMYLVSSGEDHFSLRRVDLALVASASSGVSVSTEFEGGSGRVELLSPSHIQCEINGEVDQDKRNRQPSWFYFRVDGVRGREVTVDLTGFRGEYNYKPTDGLWARRLHPAISYDNERWEFMQNVEFDAAQSRLRFKVKPEADHFGVARIPPYTNRHLARLLDEIRGSPHLTQESVGMTPKGRPIPLLTITDASIPARNKKVVWMMTRQHAWEAGTSWAGEGSIRYLVSNTPDAGRLRANYVFKILPLCDPDGVARGGVRFNANGYDLNRNWDAVDEKLMPEIAAEKKALLKWIDDGNRIDLFLTLHNTESHDYIEGPVSAGGPAMEVLIKRLWEGLHSKTSFYAPEGPQDMPSTTTPGMKGRMTVYQNLFSERRVPAVLIELMTERSPKLNREATTEDRLEFGAKLVQVVASVLDGKSE